MLVCGLGFERRVVWPKMMVGFVCVHDCGRELGSGCLLALEIERGLTMKW